MSKTRRIVTAIITIIVMICATMLSVNAMTLKLYLDTPYPETNSKINFKNSMQMNLQKDSLCAANFRAGVRVDAIDGATNIPSYYTGTPGFKVAITLSNAGIYSKTYRPGSNLIVGDENDSYFSISKNYYDSDSDSYLGKCDNVTMDTMVIMPISNNAYDDNNPLYLPTIELNSGKLIYSTK